MIKGSQLKRQYVVVDHSIILVVAESVSTLYYRTEQQQHLRCYINFETSD